jgi:hypothetical protein
MELPSGILYSWRRTQENDIKKIKIYVLKFDINGDIHIFF